MRFSVHGTGRSICQFSGGYPRWQPNPSSELLNQLQEIYEELFHKTADKSDSRRAGMWNHRAKIPGIDMISVARQSNILLPMKRSV